MIAFGVLFSITAQAENVYDTKAGLKVGSKIIRVKNLNDSGTGSLRNAIESCRGCVIVFDVAGLIRLKSNLNLNNDNILIAGETAPAPGIILHDGSINIRSRDVIISHIAIYAGSSTDPQVAENRDGISLYGSSDPKKKNVRRVILRNVSVGWGVDENIGINGDVDGVLIERSLIARPLRSGGHPKGVHSMNLLLGNTVNNVTIRGSVFAAAEQRNPRLTTGNRVSFINNIISSNGALATHLDTSEETLRVGAIDIIGNYYLASQASNCKKSPISVDGDFFDDVPETYVFMRDNVISNEFKPGCYVFNDLSVHLAGGQLNPVDDWRIISADTVPQTIPVSAGSNPLARNPIDQAVMNDLLNGRLVILNNEYDIGGMPAIQTVNLDTNVPAGLSLISSEADVVIVKNWLCSKYKTVTGIDICPYQ